MSTTERQAAHLIAGDNLSREEFLRRWEAMPELKKAELIGGTVYTPSPSSAEHADMNARICHWLSHYKLFTPGCTVGSNGTWLMGRDAPQPDADLRVLSEFGGHSRSAGRFLQGAPELSAEVCLSSAAYDLHQKFDLYRSAGMDEYVAVLLSEHEVRWHRLEAREYRQLAPASDRLLRSVVFPGLWLNAAALLADDMPEVIRTLDLGLRSAEHAQFLARLRNRSPGPQA